MKPAVNSISFVCTSRESTGPIGLAKVEAEHLSPRRNFEESLTTGYHRDEWTNIQPESRKTRPVLCSYDGDGIDWFLAQLRCGSS